MFGKNKDLTKKTKKVNEKLLDLTVKTGTTMVRMDEDDNWKVAVEQLTPAYVDLIKASLDLQLAYAKRLDEMNNKIDALMRISHRTCNKVHGDE